MICVINMKLIIQTNVTIAAQGCVIAPVTNDIVTQTRGAQVIKMCTMTIGAESQVEAPREILWTKLVRTVTTVIVGEGSLLYSDRALSQVVNNSVSTLDPLTISQMGGAFCLFNPSSELRKSRPQSAEFSQSPSPRPGRPLSGPPLVSSQSQVLM